MRYTINEKYQAFENGLISIINNFDTDGELLNDGDRNVIKLFTLNNQTINIKSFKKPNVINKIVYRFFRKSKAQRSFEYANKLLSLQVGTPQPVAYFEESKGLLFGRSYYISEHLDYDLTFRELTTDLNYPNHESILRAFTRFTFQLHEKGINFLDHSPGNTLIQLNNGDYRFYLVDLNRMNFQPMSFEARIKNMSRLTKQDALVKIMSDEYAKLIKMHYDKVYNALWSDINNFQRKFTRKRELKKKLFFWR